MEKYETSLVVSFRCETTIVVPPDALFVPNFHAVFALAHVGEVVRIDQLLLVHADFAHLARLVAGFARGQMLLKHLVIAVDMLLQDVQMKNHLNREVAVTKDEELEILVLLLID